MKKSEGSFDWVTARHACSVENLFDKLRLSIKRDVEIRQELQKALQQRYPQYGFSVASDGGTFSVTRRSKGGPKIATFKLDKSRIVVSDETQRRRSTKIASADSLWKMDNWKIGSFARKP
ncbi:MAG: hypothetical protein WBS24_18785 [Terriglobales bacterium]